MSFNGYIVALVTISGTATFCSMLQVFIGSTLAAKKQGIVLVNPSHSPYTTT